MNKSSLNISIQIKPDYENEIFYGTVIFSSTESILVDFINVVIDLEARGQMAVKKEEIHSSILSHSAVCINSNEPLEIPFSFKVVNPIESYQGENVKIKYKSTVKAIINERDRKKIKGSFFEDVKAFITSETVVKETKYFLVKNRNKQLEIKEEKNKLNIKYNYFYSIPSFILLVIIGVLLIPSISFFYKILVLIFTIFISNQIGKYLQSLFYKDIPYQIINKDGSFRFDLQGSASLKLSNIKVSYEIHEVVTDNRGTSQSTYTNTLYRSKPKILNSKLKKSVILKFPNKKKYHSFQFGDATIVYVIFLKGSGLFGIEHVYSKEFTVLPIYNPVHV